MSQLEIYWNDILMYSGRITTLFYFVPIISALLFAKYLNRPLKIFLLYSITTLLINFIEIGFIWATGAYTEVLLPYLEYWEIRNTFFLQILDYIKNFLFLGLFFSLVIPLDSIKIYFLRLGQILTIIALINYFFFVGYKEQGILNPSMNAIFIVIIPLIYMWKSQRISLRIPLKKNPYLWISLGLIIPNLLNLFLFFSGDYLSKLDFILFIKFSLLKNCFIVLGQILIAIGFAHSYYARFIKINA